MSEKYQPKRGDRVRVVVEGEVTYVTPNGFYVNEGSLFATGSTDVVSVEKVAPPLPTTPGSVVRGPAGTLYMRRDSTSHPWCSSGAVLIAEADLPKPVEVIFDAGAAK